jgi:3-methyladenine DNA glycosylase AlkC
MRIARVAEAFRNLLNPSLVQTAARHLQRAWPGFDSARFLAEVLPNFEALAMKARAMRMADALEALLPMEFEHAAAVVESSLLPVRGDEALNELSSNEHGLAGWVIWPLGEFVARRGVHSPARAMQCLHALTQRFTAEFAIRPLLIAHPHAVYAILQTWLGDPSAHVRRLISEGSRPRLPWGLALQAAIADPSPAYPLLAALQDDPSEYVRRSVANHLNDIGRDDPTRLVQWLKRYLPEAPGQRRAMLKHASRTLIKRGHPQLMACWDLGHYFQGEAAVVVGPKCVRIGDALEIGVTLRSTASTSQTLLIDYRVHHVRANGSTAPKVFKGWSVQLAAGQQCQLQRRHSLKRITTRNYFPGAHLIDLQINGQVLSGDRFELTSD